jgi:hypothetical protein
LPSWLTCRRGILDIAVLDVAASYKYSRKRFELFATSGQLKSYLLVFLGYSPVPDSLLDDAVYDER